MNEAERIRVAARILEDFAERTGVTSRDREPRRYLWTDAFAVCDLLELARRSDRDELLETARRLVDQVHEVLGRHRSDDPRSGWISGLPEEEGRRRPTAGGLRIGKRLPERGPDEPFDERREWDRDGQYFHYLTKWMHALARVAEVTDDPDRLEQAIELARAAHAGFAVAAGSPGRQRLVWKASIDLSRPLVSSTGHHDPLDGLLTFRELASQARRAGLEESAGSLEAPTAELSRMCEGVDWTTPDALGLGGLLVDAWRQARLLERGDSTDARLLEEVLRAARAGLGRLLSSRGLGGPATHRLAFRELGLALGLHAVELLAERGGPEVLTAAGPHLEPLLAVLPLADELERFWSDPASRGGESWTGHLDINEVTLATALVPGGYLGSSA